MVLGIGTDVLSTERARRLLDGGACPETAFTEAERALIASRPDTLHAFAARYAGKSAVRKALRTGRELPLREIEILEDGNGAPAVALHGETARRASEQGVRRVELSLSYEEAASIAVAAAFTD